MAGSTTPFFDQDLWGFASGSVSRASSDTVASKAVLRELHVPGSEPDRAGRSAASRTVERWLARLGCSGRSTMRDSLLAAHLDPFAGVVAELAASRGAMVIGSSLVLVFRRDARSR